MSKKLILAVISVVILGVGGYFGATKMGLLSSPLPGEAEAMAEATCACETFECTKAQTAWFNMNSVTIADQIAALSNEDAARYSAASSKSSDCQDKLRP